MPPSRIGAATGCTPPPALAPRSVDGQGLPRKLRAGVGLASMRERATELGGTCTIASVAGGGTRVHARLPVHEEVEWIPSAP